MTIAEKLMQIAENELKVYEAGRQSVGESHETIVFAQDCVNAQQARSILSANMTPVDKIVMFVNKAWTGVPNADTANNQGLWMMCFSTEFNCTGMLARWRDGSYITLSSVNPSIDYTVSAGEEWLKIVLL
jgi:hypothetical protein